MEVAEHCDLVGFMQNRRMLAESNPDELKKFAGLKKQLRMKVSIAQDAITFIILIVGFKVPLQGDMLAIFVIVILVSAG
jgi:ABC-type multidrug transport system ATPase subunit